MSFQSIITLQNFGASIDDRKVQRELSKIADAVSRVTRVGIKDLRNNTRGANYVRSRHLYFWIARNYTQCSYPQIGGYLLKDHSTAHHGTNKVARRLYAYRDEIDAIKLELSTAVCGTPQDSGVKCSV